MGMQCGYCGFELNRSVSVTREGGGGDGSGDTMGIFHREILFL